MSDEISPADATPIDVYDDPPPPRQPPLHIPDAPQPDMIIDQPTPEIQPVPMPPMPPPPPTDLPALDAPKRSRGSRDS